MGMFESQNRRALEKTSCTVSSGNERKGKALGTRIRRVGVLMILSFLLMLGLASCADRYTDHPADYGSAKGTVTPEASQAPESSGILTIQEGTTVIERLYEGNDDIITVIIPNSVVEIKGYAFQSCKNLETVTIGNSVTRIGEYAFCSCPKLKTVTMGKSVRTIHRAAFCDCKSLETVSLPDGVKTIENSVFSGCIALKSVELPDSLLTLGNRVFGGCESLESIRIPSSTTEIGEDILDGCISLKDIVLPENPTPLWILNGTAFLEGINHWWSSDAVNKATDLRNIEGLLPDLTGKRIIPLVSTISGTYTWGDMYEYLPAEIRTYDNRETNYALIKEIKWEERNDYTGRAFTRLPKYTFLTKQAMRACYAVSHTLHPIMEEEHCMVRKPRMKKYGRLLHISLAEHFLPKTSSLSIVTKKNKMCFIIMLLYLASEALYRDLHIYTFKSPGR